jgi:pyruvate,water dikinase
LAEIAYEGGNLMPELSFGTHFFQDLVESDIFYVAIFPQKENVVFNQDKLLEIPNLLTDFLSEENKYENVIKVYEVGQLQIVSDVVSQKVICFFAKDTGYLSK